MNRSRTSSRQASIDGSRPRGRGRRPLLIVISAPSGAGKTTLCNMLLSGMDGLMRSVSCTTRPPRGAEKDGTDYYFLSGPEFQRRLAAGDFIEHAEVHGHMYGTPRDAVIESLASGNDVLLAIDVQGAAQVRAAVNAARPGDPIRNAYVDIFIVPPSMEILRRRMEARNEDTAETIALRLANAEREMKELPKFMRTVVNDDLACAYGRLRDIVIEERKKHGG